MRFGVGRDFGVVGERKEEMVKDLRVGDDF